MWFGYEELAVLAFAVFLDLVLGEPPAWSHPTVWMGRMTAFLEKAAPRDGVAGVSAGALITLSIAGFWLIAAYFVAEGLKSVHIVAYILVGGLILKSTFSVRMLHSEAAKARQHLDRGDIQAVRSQMSALISRDPSQLTAQQATAATVESVSENISDSFLGPWLVFALFGLPGAFAYRSINTLDSMIGYHGAYEHLGKTAARLDDLMNLLPARLGGLLVVVASALLPGQRALSAWRIMWQHHGRTQSPNAGWTMSGMAGALGVQLEKVASQGGYSLGEPTREIETQDIIRAVRTMYVVAAVGLVLALAITYIRTGIF